MLSHSLDKKLSCSTVSLPRCINRYQRIVNHLSLSSDKNEFSLYIVSTCSNIEVTRIKKMITEDKMS